MSRYLSELLHAKEPLFTMAIRQLERESGMPRADIKLTAELINKANLKKRELGLDPKDTTGKELYYGLVNLVQLHDEFLVRSIGGKDSGDVDDLLPRMKTMYDSLDIPKKVWVIRQSVAKRLIRQCPPKKVMKYLGYKSVDSMLKRVNVCELYAAMQFAETPAWQARFIRRYKTLRPGDFESRDAQVLLLDEKRWGKLTEPFVLESRRPIAHVLELGAVLLLPMPIKRLPGICINTFPLLLHNINELRVYSAFFKLQQVKPDFGMSVAKTLLQDSTSEVVISGQKIHWRVIHRYFGRRDIPARPEIFEPHIQQEDLEWRIAEDILYRIEPALMFWKELDYVGAMHDGRPVSFNLLDMAVSYCNKLPYGQHSTYHFSESLWNEILIRYIGEKSLEQEVLGQLDGKTISAELITI